MAKITLDTSSFQRTTAREYLSRFLFGGSVTLVASLIDHHFGPVIGGLFLAFPGIFPPGASLVEKHAEEHKREEGMNGAERGRQEASLEAAGASIGAAGLAAFGAIIWWAAPRMPLLQALPLAFAAWAAVAWTLWVIREHI